jgi:hypothetical protein
VRCFGPFAARISVLTRFFFVQSIGLCEVLKKSNWRIFWAKYLPSAYAINFNRSASDRSRAMPQRNSYPIRTQFGLRGWSAIGGAIIVLGAVAVLAVGLLVFLLPVLILSPILYWLMPKPKPYWAGDPVANEPAKGATIIDGEFRVIEASASDKEPVP